MVANLWDVTDRDIDRYAAALLGNWLGQGPDPDSAGAVWGCPAVMPARVSTFPVFYLYNTYTIPIQYLYNTYTIPMNTYAIRLMYGSYLFR